MEQLIKILPINAVSICLVNSLAGGDTHTHAHIHTHTHTHTHIHTHMYTNVMNKIISKNRCAQACAQHAWLRTMAEFIDKLVTIVANN